MTRPFALAFASLLLVGAAAPPPAAYDIVIRGGRVLDGAGNLWITADVPIKDGRIARVGAIEVRGKQEIDASGRYVSPGFIDMLDQSGRVLPRDGSAANKLAMGVTTLIAGEGGTAVPGRRGDPPHRAMACRQVADQRRPLIPPPTFRRPDRSSPAAAA